MKTLVPKIVKHSLLLISFSCSLLFFTSFGLIESNFDKNINISSVDSIYLDLTIILVKSHYSEQAINSCKSLHLPVWKESILKPRNFSSISNFPPLLDTKNKEFFLTQKTTIAETINNLSDITIIQKKDINIIVEPIVDFTFNYQQSSYKSKFSSILISGTISVSGCLVFNVIDPLLNERLAIKKINFDQIKKEITIEVKGKEGDKAIDSEIEKAFANILSEVLANIQPAIKKQLNSKELLLLQSRSQELRKESNKNISR